VLTLTPCSCRSPSSRPDGELYRQFAVTIAISVVISGIVALTLSPALCVVMLKHAHARRAFFRWFNAWFLRVTATTPTA